MQPNIVVAESKQDPRKAHNALKLALQNDLLYDLGKNGPRGSSVGEPKLLQIGDQNPFLGFGVSYTFWAGVRAD
jgi:hypothetical protein